MSSRWSARSRLQRRRNGGRVVPSAWLACAEPSPTLRGVPGTDPWNAMQLLEWLCTSGGVTTGSRHAARFVLQVWNPSTDWGALAMAPPAEEGLGLKGVELAPFNVVEALALWRFRS